MNKSTPLQLGARRGIVFSMSPVFDPTLEGTTRKERLASSNRRYRAKHPERRAKAHNARRDRLAARKLARGCDKCGYNKSASALDFHHRDPTTKVLNVSGTHYAWSRVEAEIAKCDILCANCHREESYGT